MSALVDPRGPRHVEMAVRLASRPPSLQGAAVVVYDNGKCHSDFGAYQSMLDELAAMLASTGADVHQEKHFDPTSPYLHAPDGELAELAVRLVEKRRPRGAVIALGDAGVSNATARLALALEELGVPTVSLYTPLGAQLARAVSSSRAPALPILVVDQPPDAPSAATRAEGRRLGGVVLEALTVQPSADRPQPATMRRALPPQNERGALAQIDDAADLFEALTAAGLGDGLPVLLPTEQRVEDLVRACRRPSGDVLIDSVEPVGAPLTVRLLAANAAMAGCEAAQMPILVAVCEAVAHERYRLSMANITTHGSGNLILVSGPGAAIAGIQSGQGCLGPGAVNRANLAVGRTLTLIGNNVGRAVIGQGDLAVIGTPAKISYCFAEAEDSPWPLFSTEFACKSATTVTVARCEGPHNVLDVVSTEPAALLQGFALAAASGASNNTYAPAEMFVIMSHQHAALIGRCGWSKQDVQNYLFEHARVPRSRSSGRGITPSWPAAFKSVDPVPVVERPEDIVVVVSGGPGVQSAVALPWGFARAVTVEVPDAEERR
jgi:hypothetical protein